MPFVITVAPLLLGLAAWTLAVAGIFSRRYPLLRCLSWFSCACSLWFPLYSILQWVNQGDLSAVMDCIHGYTLCAGILLSVNFLLNLISALIHIKKKDFGNSCCL